MIRAASLCKHFGPVRAVEGLSFTVAPGEILGFLGPNGAGKTTTLRILAGFLPPTSGQVSVAEHDLTQASLAARRALGYLGEAFAAPSELRVGEYLRYRAALKGLPRRARLPRVTELARQLGFQDRLRQPFGALSKGFRQRIGLADALLADPPALLLDEPFGGLDPLQRLDFRNFLRDLASSGKAILFSSHVLPEVEMLADRILILDRGRMRALGERQELLDRLGARRRLRVLSEGNREALLQAVRSAYPDGRAELLADGTLLVTLGRGRSAPEFFSWLAARGEPVLEFGPETTHLEELFRLLLESPDPDMEGSP